MRTCNRLSFLLVVACLSCVDVSWAQLRPTYTCYKIPGGTVKVDGILNEKCWARTPWIELRHMKTGKHIPYPSKARILWDDDYLYAGYDVGYVDVFGKETKKDKPFYLDQEMFVKLFLDPDANGTDVFEIHVSPRNCVYDVRQAIPNHNQNPLGTVAADWNCKGFLSAVRVNGTLNNSADVDRGYTMELAIPWASIRKFTIGKCPPAPGDRWAVSPQCRYFLHPSENEICEGKAHYASWPKLGIIDSHVYDRYGYLVFSSKSPRTLEWKLAWIWSLPSKTDAQIEAAVVKAKAMGFNAIVWDTRWQPFIHACRKHGMESYALVAPDFGNPANQYEQVMLPGEEKLPSDAKDHPTYQHGGEPLGGAAGKEIRQMALPCFRHPYVLEKFREKIRLCVNRGYSGIAFDWIGYKNLHGCYCEHCKRLLKKTAPPGMSPQEAANRFQEETLTKFYKDICDYAHSYAKSMSRTVKTTCHVYPAFLPNNLYGNKLPVDYCGQTVSWFFKPHWNFEKIERYTRHVVANESLYHQHSTGAPFIAFYGKGEFAGHVKSADRIRKEIQIIKKSGARAIQFAELGDILAVPEVARVVTEELNTQDADLK